MYTINSISGGKCKPSNITLTSLNKLHIKSKDTNNNTIHLNIFINFNDTILNNIDEFDINICKTNINIALLNDTIQKKLFTYITGYNYDLNNKASSEIKLYKTLKDFTFFEIIHKLIEKKNINSFYLELISPILGESSSSRRLSLDGLLKINVNTKGNTYTITYNINNITSIDPFGVKYLKYTKFQGEETKIRYKEHLPSIFQSPSPVKTKSKSKTESKDEAKESVKRRLFVVGGTCSNIDNIYDDTSIKSTSLINKINLIINGKTFELSINILFHALKHNDEFNKSYCIDMDKKDNTIKYKSKKEETKQMEINKWNEDSSASIGNFYNLIKKIIMEEEKYECKTIGINKEYNKNIKEYIQMIDNNYNEKYLESFNSFNEFRLYYKIENDRYISITSHLKIDMKNKKIVLEIFSFRSMNDLGLKYYIYS